MRFHTYSKFSPELADAVDLQSLLEKLADFLLQSGFAGGRMSHPYWGDFGGDADRSLEALKEAILNALIESGQFTPEMLQALRGDGDEEAQAKLAQLLDDLVQRLTAEGYLNIDAPPQVPDTHQPLEGRGSLAHAASRDVQFNLTDKGIDFLGYRTLRNLLGSLGKSSVGAHDTPYLATGIESDGWSKQYEFGDVLNLDVNETLKNSLARTGDNRRSDRPGVLGPDGQAGGVPIVVRDGAHARHVALDDSLRRGSVHAGQEGRARAHAPDSHAVPGRHDSRGAVPRLGRGDPAPDARPRAGRPVPHEHRRGAQAGAPDPARAEEGHAAGHHDHRRQAERAHDAERSDLQELDGPRRHGDCRKR